jgi:amidohydrolase
MPVINRIAGFAAEMTAWRRHLHAHPELGFDCTATAAFVADRLRAFGVDDLHEGIAQTGIVALIDGQAPGPVVALRADMDALPITEATGLDHASTVPGKMHACGHDGHTAMLLGAAKYLAETRAFAGRVALIFQPAEENGGGAAVMCAEGIMDRFDIAEVYGLHNAPGLEEGRVLTTPGPIMAAVDTFEVFIEGVGGHGAMPHDTRDPIPAAASMVQALQTIVSRNHYALEDLVVSVTQIHAGSADNVIPGTAYLCGTVRTFDAAVQAMVRDRMAAIVAGQAASFGVTARLDYQVGYPATINDADVAAFAADVARDVVGADHVDGEAGREMGAEDFAYMLQERPGAYLFLGAGAGAGHGLSGDPGGTFRPGDFRRHGGSGPAQDPARAVPPVYRGPDAGDAQIIGAARSEMDLKATAPSCGRTRGVRAERRPRHRPA